VRSTAETEKRRRLKSLLVRRENNAPKRKIFLVELITHLLILLKSRQSGCLFFFMKETLRLSGTASRRLWLYQLSGFNQKAQQTLSAFVMR